MPATSEKQRKFFGLIRGIQKGTAKGSSRARKVARSISPADARDFARKRKKTLNQAIMTSILLLTLFLGLTCVNLYANEAQDISDSLVGDADFEDTITILMNHVYDKMKPNGNGISLAEARKMPLGEKYRQGVGWCNHQVDAFMEFAQRQGIRTRMIYLLNKKGHTSPHTIAEAYKDGKWVVVDVGNNLIFKKKNGQLMSRTDMKNNWDLCLAKLLPINPDKEYWEMFLRNCYVIKEKLP